MSEWREVKLGEIINLYNGKATKSNENGLYPVFGSNGIIGSVDDYAFEKGIIIGRVGAYCGSVKFSQKKFWASDNTIVADVKEGKSLLFMKYMLSTLSINSYAVGSAQPLITQGIIKNLKVSIPEISTQKKIATILSTYDKLIENNNRRIQILEQTAEELYKEWFVRMRFPGYEKTKFDKGIPEGWEVTKYKEMEF